MRLADVINPATRFVLQGSPLSRLTSSELAYVLTDPDFSAAAGEDYQDLEDGILGELADRAKRGDAIAARTMARFVEDGDHVICPTCGILHEVDYCAAGDGHGVVL
jgi:hypothetical protein